MNVRLAITGGIAEGKSTVLGYARDAGYAVLSADEIAREVFENEQIQLFLKDSLGSTDRLLVRSRIAQDCSFRRKLNSAMHPAVITRIAASDATIVEIPLLIEAVLFPLFESIWVITCGREEQRNRLFARIGDEVLTDALLSTQLCGEVKIPFADRIVRTNLDESSVKRYVLESLTIDIP